ncbi:MAG: DUF4340 domain-containing protein [Clostridia bacterium]|nr:DUF4340 domain-containing protein [Clostridia bacterium]
MTENKTPKKKKNPVLRLLLLALAAVVLYAVYSAVKAANERKAEAERLAAAQAVKTVTVAAFDPAELTELSYETPGVTDGKLRFRVVNGTWQWADDPAFPLDQTPLSAMGSAVTSIVALRELDSLETGLDGTGLADPSCTITAKYGSEAHDYLLGAYNGSAGGYYLMADGVVYLVETSMLSSFSKSLSDLLLRDSVPISDWTDRSLGSSVTVKNGGEERVIDGEEEKDAALTALSSVYLRQYAAYNADEGTKASYGLDGSRSVSVSYRKAVTTTDANGNSSTNYLDTTWTLLIGDPDPDDPSLVAAAPASSGIVYLISASAAENALNGGAEG